jgi:SecD/SecF fusion protein
MKTLLHLTGALLAALFVTSCGPKPPLHGTAFVVELDAGATANGINQLQSLNQTGQVLRKRLDKLGIRYSVDQQENGRLLVKIQELNSKDLNVVRKMIEKSGRLEFRLVAPESDDAIKNNLIRPGYEVLQHKEHTPDGRERIEVVEVSKRAEMTGSSIKNAKVVRGNLGEPQIDFMLNDEGKAKFGEITRENVGQRLAILLDGELYSAPVIQSPIESGSGQITGHFDYKEAQELANVLENPLDVPHHIVEEQSF